ncbi:VIT1/CCC1 transporter family protein [Pelagovum pacificum]|uniref:VIT1/CCC1 transporter family protein n=1 Tax=Pelagovum pacificum TaxID=2588711 RepID=UPI0018CF5084|nr:VIT1/CCC1 transporter family protein [Pelagovum pacificum]QQA41409.1 VIT1/CCC1 transporter family protein [Pelagovum pacificum]
MGLKRYLKQIVYGGNDGIVTTFAVIAGFEGAGGEAGTPLAAGIVLLFGLANLFGDATSMGLGDYISERSEREVDRAEHAAMREMAARRPDEAAAIVERRLGAQGLAADDARAVTDRLRKAPDALAHAVIALDHGVSPDGDTGMVTQAVVTFASFIAFGALPLAPYMLPEIDVLTRIGPFGTALIGSLVALVLLGLLKHRVGGGSPLRSVAEIVIVGVIAGGVAFAVGTFFELT